MKRKIIYTFLIIMSLFAAFAAAQVPLTKDEIPDPSIFGYEIEKLLNFGSGIVALILLTITLLGYKRSKNKRLVFVSIAFLLFAFKGFLTSLELFSLDIVWVDPVASVLNFAILLSFFFGVVKK